MLDTYFNTNCYVVMKLSPYLILSNVSMNMNLIEVDCCRLIVRIIVHNVIILIFRCVDLDILCQLS